MRSDETKCFICGTAVVTGKPKVSFFDRFRSFVKFAFLFSGALTVASLFCDFTPSFVKCFVSTLILMLVKSSADQMAESQ